MLQSFVLLAIAASAVAGPLPQGVTDKISPPGPIPQGCSASAPGKYELTVVSLANPSKRDLDLAKRQDSGILNVVLADSVLTDQAGRIGYIASNRQFQFDQPPQAGAIITSGFSLCSNGTLALGGSTIFYQCLSGTFYNLYDQHWAPQCSPIHLCAQPASGSPGTPVTQIPDGQPQGPTGNPVTQIPDGQPQGPGGPPSPTNAPPITQISDGQPQVPTIAPPISQPQIPTVAPPVTQISDGQPQVPTAAPTILPTPVTSAPVVTQITDGQPQVPISTPSIPAPAPTILTSVPVVPLPTIVPILTGGPIPTQNGTAPNTPAVPTQTLIPGAAAKTTYGYSAFIAAVFGAIMLF